MKNNNHETVITDLYLLAFLAGMSVLAIAMGMTKPLLINTAFLGITLVLILMTYFQGIVAGMVVNLGFIFLQALVMIYRNATVATGFPWELSFWLVLPIWLSVSFYGMTAHLRHLQVVNAKLKSDLVERGAFDEDTNLRTTVSYIEDTAVFTETNRRFKLPVTTMIVRIRYFQEMRSMMTDNQLRSLLTVISETIKAAMRSNDITYLIDHNNPTWAVLLFTDVDGANIAVGRIKSKFTEAVQNDVDLANLDIRLVVGVASWDSETMKDPYDLMNAGIKATEYDV